MTGTNGIDLSQYQAGTDITRMPGLDFVIAKATEGTTIADPAYQQWAEQAQHARAQFGAYHFGHVENLNMRAQADFFCAEARPRSLLSCWFDYETYGANGQTDAEMIGYFIREVHYNTGGKQKTGIYCNREGLARIEPWLHEIPYAALWLANPDSPMTQMDGAQVHQYEVFQGIDRNWSPWNLQQWQEFWKW